MDVRDGFHQILPLGGRILKLSKFSSSPSPREERAGVRRPSMVLKIKSPHPQSSPRLCGERETGSVRMRPLYATRENFFIEFIRIRFQMSHATAP